MRIGAAVIVDAVVMSTVGGSVSCEGKVRMVLLQLARTVGIGSSTRVLLHVVERRQ